MYSSAETFSYPLLQRPLILFDGIMTYIGPFLFFWGLTKILIRDSDKFQRVASKISSVMGDLGALAAKNVRRNPARLAAIAFMIAFIIGFSVQVTGQIASQQDYIVRNVHAQVGGRHNMSAWYNASKAPSYPKRHSRKCFRHQQCNYRTYNELLNSATVTAKCR